MLSVCVVVVVVVVVVVSSEEMYSLKMFITIIFQTVLTIEHL